MASVAKFRLNEAPRLLSHCSRSQKSVGTHIHKYRTELNFNMAQGLHEGQTDYEFVKNRIHQPDITMMKRDDVKVVCDWAITMPRELCHEVVDHEGEEYFVPNDMEECREFFQHAYDFFKEKHGEQNIISANVHMDENVPHMHFAFVPIVRDKKDKHLKVCAKEALSDCYGAKFQIELQDYVSAKMGKELHMVRQDTVDYERNVKELKKKTLNERCAYLARQITKEQEKLDKTKAEINALAKAAETDGVSNIKVSTSDGLTVMRESDWKKIQAQLRFINAMKAERKEIYSMLKEFENTSSVEQAETYKQQAQQLMRENEKMDSELSSIKLFMEHTENEDGKTLMDMYKEDLEERKEIARLIHERERGERSRI